MLPLLYVFTFLIFKILENKISDNVINYSIIFIFSTYIIFSIYNQNLPINNSTKYIGTFKQTLIFSITILMFVTFKNRLKESTVLFAIFFAISALSVQYSEKSNFDKEDRPMGIAYMDVQKWANSNTEKNALFLIDPSMYYGWREYSQRSSFGNVREWLHTSWLYESNKNNFDAGISRALLFGINPEFYKNRVVPHNGFIELEKDLRENFYNLSSSRFKEIMLENQINFLVLKKNLIKNKLNLNVVYENTYFIVYRPK